MYLKKQIEVEIIRNPNLLGYTLEGISNIWTKEDVILTFVPNENNIEKYCVKGECSTNKEFTIEKNETFETYIIDENGNKSEKNTYEVTNIDKEPPIIKKVTEYNNKGKRYIGVQGEDTLSGVTEYSYDGGKTYSTSSTKEVSSGQIITIKIKDLVGNESEEYKYTVENKQVEELPKDTTAPTFIVTRTPEANSIGWNNTNVLVTIKAEDDISGIASYSFDNGNTWETTNTKEVSSTTTVTIKVKDNAGNISESKSVELKIDKVFPVIGGIGDDYNERMEITIEEDNLYNVELTKNGEDIINCPENNNCIFSKKIVEGRGLYQLKVTDKAGNETSTTFTIKAKGDTPKITGVINGNYYNESVTPYVEGEPKEEIKERTTLKKDNEIIYSYKVGDTLEEEGVYDIQAKNRHNESDEVIFYIDKTLPELEIEKEGSELNITARDKNLETVVIFKDGIPEVCFAPEAGEEDGVTCEKVNYVEEEGKKVLEYTYILEEAIKYEVIATDKAGNSINSEFTYSIEEEPEEEIVEGSTLDWLVSEEENETGGYTLLAFIGEIEDCENIEVLEKYYTEENINPMYYDMSGYETYEDILNKNGYKITIPNEVDGKTITELGFFLFQAMNILTGTQINESYTRIQEVIIPEGIVKINGYLDVDGEGQIEGLGGSFLLNVNLNSVTLPSTLETIGEYTFGYNNLTTLTISPSVTTIGIRAFIYNNLIEVTIPSSVTTIGEAAFYSNPNLSTIIVKRANNTGMELGYNWNGTATVNWDPS